MKTRRAVLAGVIFIGLVVLVLGFTGVLAPREEPPESPPAPDAEPGASKAEGFTAEASGFRTEGENWILTAPKVRFEQERGAHLTSPELRIWREKAEGGERAEARADSGTYVEQPERRVSMTGNVYAKVVGEETLELFAEMIEVDPGSATGRADGPIRVVSTTEDGRQALTGRDADVDFKKRTIRIKRDIRLEIKGAGAFLSAEATKDKKPPAVDTVVTCRGPVFADGFRRTAVLEGDVVVQQGENALRGQRVEIRFGEEAREPSRLLAEGDVTFTAAGAEGACDRLLRTAAEGRIVLEGNPVTLRQAASRIRAAKVVMDPTAGRVSVPVAGNLVFVQESEDAAAKRLTMKWARSMEFDRGAQRAVFRGDVNFSYEGQGIACERLTVFFDETGRKLLKCRAEENVNVRAEIERPDAAKALVTAYAEEMVYEPDQGALVLAGGVDLKHEGLAVTADRVEIDPAKGAIRVPGGGSLSVAGSLAGAADATGPADPVSVSWAHEMHFDRTAGEARFERDVVLDYGGRKLKADTVRATLSDENALDGFEAEGNVSMHETGDGPARSLHANRLTARMGKDNTLEAFEATGNVSLEEKSPDDKSARLMKADRLFARIGKENALEAFEAVGNVNLQETAAADRPTRTMRSDRLKATLGADRNVTGFEAVGGVVLEERAPGAERGRTLKTERLTASLGAENTIERVETFGGTRVEDGGVVAIGRKLVWNTSEDQGRLTGSPVQFRSGAQRLFGDVIEFSREPGRVRITSRTRVEGALQLGGDLVKILP